MGFFDKLREGLSRTKQQILSRFDEIVEFANVSAFIDTAVKRYSSGMNLRLAFAVAAFLEGHGRASNVTYSGLPASRYRPLVEKYLPRGAGALAGAAGGGRQRSLAERRAREAEGRSSVIRFRIPPDETIAFDDLVRGHVEIATSALGGDLVIVRSDGTPLYHFAVCVDDAEMAISHVIRGEDHLSNTPKHILLFQALGAPVPAFAHLPLILNPDRTKMSKRKSQTAVSDYLAQGFVPVAIVNHLALLGWASGSTEELFSLELGLALKKRGVITAKKGISFKPVGQLERLGARGIVVLHFAQRMGDGGFDLVVDRRRVERRRGDRGRHLGPFSLGRFNGEAAHHQSENEDRGGEDSRLRFVPEEGHLNCQHDEERDQHQAAFPFRQAGF